MTMVSFLQDVNEALRRLPQEEQDLRLQRLKRAADCSLKKQYLPKDVQKAQTPYNFYLDVSLSSGLPNQPLPHGLAFSLRFPIPVSFHVAVDARDFYFGHYVQMQLKFQSHEALSG